MKKLIDMTLREILGDEATRLETAIATAHSVLNEMREFHTHYAPKGFKSSLGYRKGDEEAPFFSETFLYILLGKDDARTVLHFLNRIEEAFQASSPRVAEMSARFELEAAVENHFSYRTKDSLARMQRAWLKLDQLRKERERKDTSAAIQEQVEERLHEAEKEKAP